MENQTNPKPQDLPKKLRGFIFTVVNTKEDYEAVQKGESNQIELSPVLAENDQAAVAFIQQQNKYLISVTPFEMLELQYKLLVDLANNNNIELLRENIFTLKQNN